MKYFAALFALGLACFQQVALAQAPADNPPVFQNTPGLLVAKPQNGMTVYQGSSIIISGLLSGQQPLASIFITVAKPDGSSNTTIVDVKGQTLARVMQLWNVDATTYPVGDYHFQMIVTPNLSAPRPSTRVAAATTTTAAAPVPTQPPATSPGVYYWRGLVHVAEAKDTPSSAVLAYGAGSMQAGALAIFYKMSLALGALALGMILIL